MLDGAQRRSQFYDFVIFGVFGKDIADAIFPSSVTGVRRWRVRARADVAIGNLSWAALESADLV